MNQLPTLTHLLKQLQQVPYLASKNLYKVVTHFLDMDSAKAEQFCKAILEAKNNILKCDICCAWKERERPCLFCDDVKRNQGLICVVETWQELLTIEKTGGYHGTFHVLGGAICPLDGIGPENLSINQLVTRCAQDVDEIILATNQTPEGEATAAYIASKLKGLPVIVSCLARGMPVGSSLEYMDRLTVYKAISERRLF